MVNFPSNTERISIIGKTGTGKSHAGLWHLSIRDFKTQWIILNTKNEPLFFDIPHAREIDYNYNFQSGGVSILTPVPGEEDEKLNDFLLKIWEKEDVGILVDEALDIGNLPAYKRIIRQGRSKNIPLIQLMQRPSGVNRLVVSESEYFQIFDIIDDRDRETIENFVPIKRHWGEIPSASFYSYYYDVKADKLLKIEPLPPLAVIFKRLNQKLKHKIKII